MCAQSHALGTRTKFQLKIISINIIFGIVYFREIILECSRNVSETTPGLCFTKMKINLDRMYHFQATVFYVRLVGVEESYKLWWKTFIVFQNQFINYMYSIKMTTSMYY